MSYNGLKSIVANTLREAMGALKMLDVIEMRLIMGHDMKIEEIITSVRIIKGVATVSQISPVNRIPNGNRVLDVLITFDSQDLERMIYIDALARLIKKINDVKTVVLKQLNGVPIKDDTGERKLVY